VSFLVVTPLFGFYKISLVDILAHLTFLHSLTPAFAMTISAQFWSLTPEVVFYCLVPLVILKLPLLWQRLVLFVVLFLIGLYTHGLATQAFDTTATFAYGQMNPNTFYERLPITLLYLFFAGVLLRMMVEWLNARPVSPLQPYIALALFLSSLVAFVIAKPDLRFLNPESLGWTVVDIPRLVQHVALIGFFASALLGAPILRRLLKWRPLSFIGLISYSMFVFHFTVIVLFDAYFLRGEGVKDWLVRDPVTMWASFLFYFLFMFVAICVISYFGYRYIESPFLRIKPK
jgi:peptidoglycan/LPS O-acetylase OafA/YrhL